MAGEALHWIPTTESGMVELVDLDSDRSVRIARPDADDLPDVALLESHTLVLRWLDPQTRPAARSDIADLAARQPIRTLRALSWLGAFWAVVRENRTGTPADVTIRRLDYHGGWQGVRTAEAARLREGLTQRVRLGAMAALTEDPRAVDAYRKACTDPPEVVPMLLRHTVIHLVALSRELRRHGLDTPQLLPQLLAHTSPSPSPRPRFCFRPSHQV